MSVPTPPSGADPRVSEPTRGTPALARSAAVRRGRYGLQTVALLFAVTAVCVFAGLIADRYRWQADLTATGEHRLSERTRNLLRSLDGEYEIVVTANIGALDPAGVRRTRDILDSFARAGGGNGKLKVTMIDVASSRGVGELDAVLARLIERFKGPLEAQGETIRSAAESAGGAGGLSTAVEQLGAAMQSAQGEIGDGDPNAAGLKRFYVDSSAVLRIGAKNLTEGAATTGQNLVKGVGGTRVPALDEAALALRKPLSELVGALSGISQGLDGIRDSKPEATTSAARARAAALGTQAAGVRDQAARMLSTIDDLVRLPIISVARALGRASVAVVIAPPTEGKRGAGVTAVDMGALFPPAGMTGAAERTVDVGARAEELLGGALASVMRDDAPIVVIVHGATQAERLAPEFAPLSALVGRLRMRGMTVEEWMAGTGEEVPNLARIDPPGKRPVVYATISTNALNPEGAVRMAKLAGVIKSLVESGKNVLLSVAPSTSPGIGQADPMTESISGGTGFGIAPDSGRPLLWKYATAEGNVVSPDTFVTPGAAEWKESNTPATQGGTIDGAIESLRVHLPWAIPLKLDTGKGAKPLLVVDDDDNVWAESEWLRFRQTPIAQRPGMSDPPAENSARDDGKGPWVVAATGERSNPLGAAGVGGGRPQRIVVVGSNGWFLNEIANRSAMADTREVLENPGNLELFESSVYWLARQDELVASSPGAKAVARIPRLSEGQISAIRWGLIAGLPLLVLAIGAVWRVVRG